MINKKNLKTLRNKVVNPVNANSRDFENVSLQNNFYKKFLVTILVTIFLFLRVFLRRPPAGTITGNNPRSKYLDSGFSSSSFDAGGFIVNPTLIVSNILSISAGGKYFS